MSRFQLLGIDCRLDITEIKHASNCHYSVIYSCLTESISSDILDYIPRALLNFPTSILRVKSSQSQSEYSDIDSPVI